MSTSRVFPLFRVSHQRRQSNIGVDAEASIPQKGFLANSDGDVFIALPSHLAEFSRKASRRPKPLMLVDALDTIINSYRKARLILYETARLQLSLKQHITTRSIKLKEDALILDQALAALGRDDIYKGVGEPDRRWTRAEYQVALAAMKEQEIKDQIDVLMRVCRGVEKDFRDSILAELTDGMIDTKKAVDHKGLREQLEALHKRLNQAHSEANNIIYEVTERHMATQSNVTDTRPNEGT